MRLVKIIPHLRHVKLWSFTCPIIVMLRKSTEDSHISVVNVPGPEWAILHLKCHQLQMLPSISGNIPLRVRSRIPHPRMACRQAETTKSNPTAGCLSITASIPIQKQRNIPPMGIEFSFASSLQPLVE